MPPKPKPRSAPSSTKKSRKSGEDADEGSISPSPPPPAALSHQEEEEMSSALIAKLLAEDGMDTDEHAYYAEYSNDRGLYDQYKEAEGDDSYEDEDDDDVYVPKSKAGRGRGRGRGGRGSRGGRVGGVVGRGPKKVATPTKKRKSPSGPDLDPSAEPGDPLPTPTSSKELLPMDTDAGASDAFTPDPVCAFAPAPAPTPLAVPALAPATVSAADANISADPAPTTVVAAEPQPPKEKKERAKKEKPEKPEKPERREMKTVPEGMNTGVYTEEEERLFLEGLERFGRDWQRLSQHMVKRDPNSIRSHAQKHFIKLFRDGIQLPNKVRESGAGYTLSGKELDPNSAAAKPYLSKMNLDGSAAAQAQAGAAPAKRSEATPRKKKEEKQRKGAGERAEGAEGEKADGEMGAEGEATVLMMEGEEGTNPAAQKRQGRRERTEEERAPKTKKPKLSKPAPSSHDSDRDDVPRHDLYGEDGRTDYSKSRLRQHREQRSSVNWAQLDDETDPLTMVKCEPFSGKPGSGVHGCQPFAISVHSNVLLAMDFHAHLMTTEVIGFLAGEWGADERKMTIKAAFPCRSLQTGQNHVNVEMDPTSAIEVRQAIEDCAMRVVGWYHSHPTFVPDPSLIDIHNQRNYQVLCRDNEREGVEPFVGAIVGPYDPRLPGSASVINWFCVSDLVDDRGHPKRLTYDLHESTEVTQEEGDRLFNLLQEYKSHPEKVNFAEFWRQDAHESKLQKLIKSLARRMPWIQRAAALVTQPIKGAEDPADEEGKENVAAVNMDNVPAPPPVIVTPTDEVGVEKAPGVGAVPLTPAIKDVFLARVEETLGVW